MALSVVRRARAWDRLSRSTIGQRVDDPRIVEMDVSLNVAWEDDAAFKIFDL
jgi:hypothetical protein